MFSIPWRFDMNLTFGSFNKECPVEYGLQNNFFDVNRQFEQPEFNFIKPLLFSIVEKANLDFDCCIRCFSFLQTFITEKNQISDIHIDYPKEHISCIYYVHDIDGDTILYKNTYPETDLYKMSSSERKTETNNFEILTSVTPKKNRVVIFDGFRYHAASTPTKGPRCVINFNIHGNNKNFFN
jgi:hypothetical protein